MSTVEIETETIEIVDDDDIEDSDCEIVTFTPGSSLFVDKPDYIDPSSLEGLIDEPSEELPSVVSNIVKKLSNDEEFIEECDKSFKDNLDIDVDLVQIDVKNVLLKNTENGPKPKTKNVGPKKFDIRTVQELPKLCSLCKESNDHLKLLQIHLTRKHHMQDDFFICPFCDYTSAYHRVITKHTVKVHKLVSVKHECQDCDFTTSRGDIFNRHLNNHRRDKAYFCRKCNFKTISLECLRKHMNTKHKKSSKKSTSEYKCTSCDSKFNTKVALMKHVNTGHPKKNTLKCDTCSYTTTSAHNLKRHKQTHMKELLDNEFVYMCDDCTFKTNKLEKLKHHTLINHPKVEILFCNICDFSTTDVKEMNEHRKLHMKYEPNDNGY